ncbi:urease accessory protein UreD [Donghicola sp. B5-SW-15]|uniref:Urease accessory protein UreD n=1 Tax=Donghicola mangrovi TaxID=2729614 RepID=A0A850Q0J9_9RHOB|nr:urease accessory protein UreD [Donghicola mangrovi]
MTCLDHISTKQPRSHGTLLITSKTLGDGRCGLGVLRQQGSAKFLSVSRRDAVEGVVINTSGGITGGDTLRIEGQAGEGAVLRLTTQAAERIYSSNDQSSGTVSTHLTAAPNARLDWLPQETILFDNAYLRRSLEASITSTSRFLMVEPVIFGRLAMGETVRQGQLSDRITIRRDGRILFRDATMLRGDISAQLDRPGVGNRARAMAFVLYASPDAEAYLDRIRTLLPPTAGASLVTTGALVMRFLAPDGFGLRQALLPVLDLLTGNDLPRSWRL